MHKDVDLEQEKMLYRMQQLFNDFYFAGIGEPGAGHTGSHEQVTIHARHDAAAGGKHEHKD